MPLRGAINTPDRHVGTVMSQQRCRPSGSRRFSCTYLHNHFLFLIHYETTRAIFVVTDIATSGVWGNYRSHYARLVDTPLAGIQCSLGIQAFARSRSGSRRAAHSQRATPSLVASGISPMFLRATRAVCVSECNALALVSSGIHAGRRADKRPCRTCALLLDIRSVCVPLCCCCPTTFHQSARIHGSQLTPPPQASP